MINMYVGVVGGRGRRWFVDGWDSLWLDDDQHCV